MYFDDVIVTHEYIRNTIGGLHKYETLMDDSMLHVDAFKHTTPCLSIIFEALNESLKDLGTILNMTNSRRGKNVNGP